MIKGKCCICGTVRNCEKYIINVFNNIETIGNIFDDYKIIISYDSSNDNTLTKLHDYKIFNPNRIILHIETEQLSNFRVYNIARARNRCLEIIRANFSDYEYFIMIDCDDICSKPVKIDDILYYLMVYH